MPCLETKCPHERKYLPQSVEAVAAIYLLYSGPELSEDSHFCEKSSDQNSPVNAIWDNGHAIDIPGFLIFS